MTGPVFTDFAVEFPFEHSTGPAVGRFLGALRDRLILGRRCDRCERVVVPANDHCETCGRGLGEWVELGPSGVVTGITVVAGAVPSAFARVRLDGAGTDLVHRADPGLAVGDRVRPKWSPGPTGSITDLDRFVADDGVAETSPGDGDPVVGVPTRLRLPFRFSAGALGSRFAESVRAGRLHGVRCPSCRALFVPPRPVCPRCWTRAEGWEPVPDVGIVETFVIVNVPFPGQEIAIPYVLANVRLDGVDVAFLHLVGEAGEDGKLRPPRGGVRIGDRVRASWRPPAARTGWLSEDVDHFEVTAPAT